MKAIKIPCRFCDEPTLSPDDLCDECLTLQRMIERRPDVVFVMALLCALCALCGCMAVQKE